jgi:hypothetical protein
MRTRRSALVALAATLGTVVAMALPNPAMAAGYEWDYAVAGTVPDGLKCASITGAKICYELDGDRWWVKDTSADHASAVARWQNYRNGVLYREGGCRNSLGSGEWGVCNKNYYEDSGVYAKVCVVDFSENTERCSADSYIFQEASFPA